MKNPKCWARKLDDCSNKITGEHRVSVAAWPSEPGCTRATKERRPILFLRGNIDPFGGVDTCAPGGFERQLTLKNLVVNALCDKHNPDLTEVDSASGPLTRAIRDFYETWKIKRSIEGLRYTPLAFRANGPLLERWMIKSAIVNFVGEKVPIGSFDAEPGTPTDELVDMAFGRMVVCGHVGLWGAGVIGTFTDETDGYGFLPWYREHPAARYIGGCLVVYRGLRFAINLDRNCPLLPERLARIRGWHGCKFVRPIRAVEAAGPNLRIEIEWPPSPRPDATDLLQDDKLR
jgi:hypothetical protein